MSGRKRKNQGRDDADEAGAAAASWTAALEFSMHSTGSTPVDILEWTQLPRGSNTRFPDKYTCDDQGWEKLRHDLHMAAMQQGYQLVANGGKKISPTSGNKLMACSHRFSKGKHRCRMNILIGYTGWGTTEGHFFLKGGHGTRDHTFHARLDPSEIKQRGAIKAPTAKKKKTTASNTAVGEGSVSHVYAAREIKNMFLQQGEMWSAWANNIESGAPPVVGQPWSASLDQDQTRPTIRFGEGEAADTNDLGQQSIAGLRTRLRDVRNWEFNRPEGGDDGGTEISPNDEESEVVRMLQEDPHDEESEVVRTLQEETSQKEDQTTKELQLGSVEVYEV